MSPQPKKRTPGAVDNSARVDKAREESNATADPRKRIPGERLPIDPISTQAAEVDHVLALLSGQEATGNETVQYFIDKGRTLAEEGVALEKTLGQLQHDAAAASQRMAAIRFELESTKKDIAHWIKRPGVKPPELQPVE